MTHPHPTVVQSAAAEISRRLASAARQGGQARIVTIDGRAGTGKTTLAEALAVLTDATVIHLDDLYDGWAGLAAGIDQAATIVGGAATGSSVAYRRYNWTLGRYDDALLVEVGDVLIVEGVGAGAEQLRPRVDLAVWLESPADLRRQRALQRGGEDFATHWDDWATLEELYIKENKPDHYADLRYDFAAN
jgi:uridine kinase